MKRILLLMVLLAFASMAGATEYYVATSGDNGASGDLTHPWQNVSYAVQHVSAGDSINLFDGIWYEEYCDFTGSGTSGNAIILTAYNGTPELNATTYIEVCINTHGYSHINISDIHIAGYDRGIQNYPGSHINVTNCTIDRCDYAVYLSGSNYSVIDGCTLTRARWSTIQLSAEVEPIHNVTISNNFFNQSIDHGHLDLNVHYGMADIDITGNTFKYAGSDTMGSRDKAYGNWAIIGMNISNNIYINNVSNPTGLAINSMGCTETIFHNNSFYDYNSYGARLLGYNITATDNFFATNGTDYRIEINNSYNDTPIGIVTSSNDAFSILEVMGGEIEITNPVNNSFVIKPFNFCLLSLNYTDGSVFEVVIPSSCPYIVSDINYYADLNCNITINSTSYAACAFTFSRYNVTLNPTLDILQNVTVNHDSVPGDDHTNITINSSVSSNNVRINATMQNASYNYNVLIDGVYTVQVVSDANKVARYHYTGSWDSPHDFEVTDVWTRKTSGNYWNVTSPITTTIKGYGDRLHIFSRTPTENDNETTTFKVVVAI